ncbi:hypothetical protein [Pseudidiomarina sp.]|uniref:hypothetical protein n=1 Tax=Pseudidiomarina sp. TaxID=2081707 RepID=UPI00299D83A4|nr:hypothetical protein [Pseudidiomarina sp.]MDX1706254.1 hypothetical protein [Pseudidiomarina sp.]
MIAADLSIPGWQFSLIAEMQNRTVWQILAPVIPEVKVLNKYLRCDLQQQLNAIWMCAVGNDLWLFQHDDTGYWLTHLHASAGTGGMNRYPDWLGELLYENQNAEGGLAIFINSRSAAQLWQFLKLRFANREPSLREIQHGQFHLLLQDPRQDIMVLSQGTEYLVLLLGNTL